MSSAMVHHWREKEREKFTAEAEKSAETVKEAVERTDRIREQQRVNCAGNLSPPGTAPAEVRLFFHRDGSSHLPLSRSSACD